MLLEPNARLPSPKKARRWDWMGAPGEVLWDAPQGLYDAEGVRRRTVFDGAEPAPAPSAASADSAPSASAKEAADTDATVVRLLRDLAVS